MEHNQDLTVAYVAVSAAQIGASISYAEERAVLTLGLVLDIECDESSNNFDYAKSLLSIVYPEQFVKELRQATTIESLVPYVATKAVHDLAEGDETIDYEGIETEVETTK